MGITLTERIESLKVGGIAAVAFTVPSVLFLGVHTGLWGESLTVLTGLVRLGGSIVSGFLFGVTYRYIVRNDENPHLRDGAVAAFSLVRGVVPLQLSEDLMGDGASSGIFLGESFICFLVSRWAVDGILARK